MRGGSGNVLRLQEVENWMLLSAEDKTLPRRGWGRRGLDESRDCLQVSVGVFSINILISGFKKRVVIGGVND